MTSMVSRAWVLVALLSACARSEGAGDDADGGTTADDDGHDDDGPGDDTNDDGDGGTLDESDGGSADDADTGDDTGVPTCDADGFLADAMAWSLPPAIAQLEYDPFWSLGGGGTCSASGNSDFSHTTFDLTGDGVPDLVVTNACDTGDVGEAMWLVYPGGADGFAADPLPWSLPEAPAALEYDPFWTTGGGGTCSATGNSDFSFSTLDLTGDGLLDLVVTNACDTGDVGEAMWIVYPGTGDGFADDAIAWSLPDSPVALEYDPFWSTGGGGTCSATGNSDFSFALLDLTGDRTPDLVVTNACDAGAVGEAIWMVYPGGSDGFADEPLAWSLPEMPVTLEYDPFWSVGGGGTCSASGNSDFSFATLDLTGDDIPDLVVTNACDAGDVGEAIWLVYPGGSDGFADEAVAWTLPESPVALEYDPFWNLGGGGTCSATGNSDFSFTTTDLTADGVPDLVLTNACDGGDVGEAIWLVYRGGADGFAAEAAAWSLPESPVALAYDPFWNLGGGGTCSATGNSDFSYATVDLTDDRAPDLVISNACDAGDVGAAIWMVFPARCE